MKMCAVAGWQFGQMKNVKDSVVEATTKAGERIEGELVRLGRFDAVWTTSRCFESLRTSEALATFKITAEKRLLYEGRASIRKLVDMDTGLLCEVTLDEQGVNVEMLPPVGVEGLETFYRQWTETCQVDASFKLAVADMAALLGNLQSWMNLAEVALRALDPAEAQAREQSFLAHVLPRVIASVYSAHQVFEEQAARVRPELRPFYQRHAALQLGDYFRCAPFGYRTFHKPLGYAGDYEMMNMVHRNAPEGGSLFARAMHGLLVSQWPAQSVRNRIAHLGELLMEETARVVRAGRRARVLNLGCGPAREVELFMQRSALSDHADFVLLDFNEETLNYTRQRLESVRRASGRRTGIETRQMSVHQVLRAAMAKTKPGAADMYDLTYCAGLFDYLTDSTCRAIVKLFCQQTNPGGLTAIANMFDAKPFRHFIEFILDWNLIYRDTRGMWAICPPEAVARTQVIAEPTGVNLFLQIRQTD